ncbi:MAG: HEAT repeat domain-containing protein [Candidatus Ratteibacteria bacterium]
MGSQSFSFTENSFVVVYGTKSKKIEFIKNVLKKKNKVYIKEIAEFLKDEDKDVRSLASYTLYEIGDSTCIDYYKKALQDSYWQVRLYGIKGLVKFGEGDILDDLISSLDDSYWQVRYYAAIGIGKYGNEDSIEPLISHLKDENIKVKEVILISLKNLMWKNISRASFKSMSEDQLKPVFDCFGENEQIKLLTISLFESAVDKRCIPYLVKLLSDESDEIKIKSLWVLEKFKTSNIEEIESLLNEPSVKVKIETIKTIVRLKAEDGIEGLINGLNDENERVRIYSLWALEKFKNPSSYPEIVNCLADSSLNVRNETMAIIERLKDPLLIPILEKFIENKKIDIEYRKLGLIELGKVGKSDLNKAKEILKKYLKTSNKELRYASIESFYFLDRYDDDYLKCLVYMEKNDPDLRIRKASSRYLNEIVKEFISMIKSSREFERKFVIEKIENLIGCKEINKLLLEMFYSKYPEVKEKALQVLKETPNKIFSKNVKELIKSPDIEIKKLCAILLGEIKDKSSINLLKEGLKYPDSEYQLICALALCKMGRKDGIGIILKNIDNQDINFQKLAIEGIVYLNDKYYSYILFKKLFDSELDIKLLSAYGLARMGEVTGLETLVRFSEINVEPIRTLANIYLQDKIIPLSLRNKIQGIREEIYRSKIGIQEIRYKVIYSYKTDIPIEIDGKDNERIWKMIEEKDEFIKIVDEKVPVDIQTKVASVYDDKNIYFLFICENPIDGSIEYDSRDFITISIDPKNSLKEWYQFVFHPLLDIKYSYVWKFYKDDESEKIWNPKWKVQTNLSGPSSVRRWIAEISIPLKDLKIEKVEDGIRWSINFQREINNYVTSTWTGRIDIPEQFGLIIFKENL